MAQFTLIDYRAARAHHLNTLRGLRAHRRADGSYPDRIGLRVSKIQTYLIGIRKLLVKGSY